jgi:hypothetical protein
MNEFEAQEAMAKREEVAYWQEMRATLRRNVEIWRDRHERAQAAYDAALDAADAANAEHGSELEEAAHKAAVWLRYTEEQRDMHARHHDDADLRVRQMTDGFIGGGE